MCSLHSALRLDLRKNKLEDLKKIVNEVLQVIERDEEMPSNRKSHMPNLTDLIVRGKPPSVFLTRFNPVVPLLKKAPPKPFSHNTHNILHPTQDPHSASLCGSFDYQKRFLFFLKTMYIIPIQSRVY